MRNNPPGRQGDQGLAKAQLFVEALIDPALVKIIQESLHKDAKSEFQVWAQARYNITPRYEVVASSGPDHAKIFTMQVLIGDEAWGEGSGTNKQSAAQAAAAAALAQAAGLEE